ncbi:MAG: hypothetical protein LBH00_12275, partial [Planctomycetaceae bacterium]|nr:hypothetical protein [Planctomycetaceae bacterium]
ITYLKIGLSHFKILSLRNHSELSIHGHFRHPAETCHVSPPFTAIFVPDESKREILPQILIRQQFA